VVAWQAYSAMLTPTPQSLAALRANYLGIVELLLAAEPWANEPGLILDCNLDLDRDGQKECILASENVFTILEVGNATVRIAFVRDENGIHQIVAPMEQFTVGLSDPLEWKDGTDPQLISGAFIDGLEYVPEYGSQNEIVFGDAQREKRSA